MNIGDEVRVKDDLEVGKMYGSCSFSKSMVDYLGKEGIVRENKKEYFLLNFDKVEVNYKFTEEMIDLIKIESTSTDIEESEEITEDVVQAVAVAIVDEAEETGKTVDVIVDEIVEESKDEIIPEVNEKIESTSTKKTNKK